MNDNLESLISALQAARLPEPDDNDTEARARIRKSLAAVMNFLRTEGIAMDLRAPFQHLYAALEDISQGRSNELLEPATMNIKNGTPKKRTFDQVEMAMAAAAVSILREDGGWTLNRAVRTVAGELSMHPPALSEFRKNIGKRRAPAQVLEEYTKWRLDRQQKYPELSPEAYVKTMMETARALTQKKG